MFKLCFDYGHGGSDPGAVYMDRKEKDDVLYLGRKVANKLRKHGIIVDETRTRDVGLSLSDRSKFERRCDYDYFISFHRNAFKPEEAKGIETFVYVNPTKKAMAMANSIQNALVKDIGLVDRGVKKANFYLLRKTKSPAILVEIGFIDNSFDNILFDWNSNRMTRAISKAILSQLGIYYKE